MNYKELSNFTHKELHHFHHAQLEKDKFVLIDYFSKHENEIPEAIINKLYELCNQTVKAYTEASNEKISFKIQTNKKDLKYKLECINLIFSILQKVITLKLNTDGLIDCFKSLISFINDLNL